MLKEARFGWRLNLECMKICVYIYTLKCITSLLASEILTVVPFMFLNSFKIAKVTATFGAGWMFSCASSFKNRNRAHVQGAEMSTTEKIFSSFKVWTEKSLVWWQRIAVWDLAAYSTKKFCLLLVASGWAFFCYGPKVK